MIHPWPKFSPKAVGPGFTPLCEAGAAIVLFNGSYSCLPDYGTYDTSQDPAVEAVITFVSGRTWIHTRGGEAYCFVTNFATFGTYTEIDGDLGSPANIQLSSNDSSCAEPSTGFICNYDNNPDYVGWQNSPGYFFACDDTSPPATTQLPSGDTVAALFNGNNGRVWFHENPDGSG